MDRKTLMMKEMQMLTGILTNDYDYLLMKLLKKAEKTVDVGAIIRFEQSEPVNVEEADDLDEWFGLMEELPNEGSNL